MQHVLDNLTCWNEENELPLHIYILLIDTPHQRVIHKLRTYYNVFILITLPKSKIPDRTKKDLFYILKMTFHIFIVKLRGFTIFSPVL